MLESRTCLGEQLGALAHAGQGIQTRIYRLQTELSSPGARPSFFKDPDLEKVRRSLDKHFPKRDTAAKEKGWEKCNENIRARSILEELSIGYETLKEATKYKEAALVAIRRAPVSINRDPRGSIPSEEQYWPGLASRYFLDVLSIYVKLACQIERLGSDCRTYVAGYNCAFFALHGHDDESFQQISNYVKLFEEGHTSSSSTTTHILRSIVNELLEGGNGESITELVSYLLETIKPWFVPANAWQTYTYAASTFPEPSAAPCDVTKCAPVCFRDRARGWVIWSLLACPGALASARTKISPSSRHEILLKSILNEIIVEPIFRDQTIRVHDEFFELFTFFPSKTHHAVFKERFDEFLTVKPKKLVNDCALECTNRAALLHRERRVILAQLLLNVSYQLQNNPAFMGPKAAAVVSVLAASKEELLWYLAHQNQPPPKVQTSGLTSSVIGVFTTSDTKYVKEDWEDGTRVGVLLSLHSNLYDQARSLWWISEQYHYELIKGPDLLDCKTRGLVEHYELMQTLQSPSSKQDISECLFACKLLELRHETTIRPSSSLYSSCSGYGDFFLPQLFFHLSMLGERYLGKDRCGFDDPVILKNSASLCNVIFFLIPFESSFEDTLRDQPRHCLGFVDSLSTIQDALHPYCGEEFNWLAERTGTQADSFLKKIQDRLVQSLDEYSLEKSRLDGQIDPIRAADRISRLLERKAGKREVTRGSDENGLNRVDLKPGFESLPKNRDALLPLARAQRSLRGICASLGRKLSNSVYIWDRAYCLREYEREVLIIWLEKKLKATCSVGANIQRPSILAEHFFRSFDTIRFACEHGGFDSTFLIRQAWIRETSGEPGTVVDLISQWFLKFLENRLTNSGVVYSSFSGGFVRVRELDSSGSSNQFRAEMWLDQTEMDALSTIIGYRGFRSIQRHLQSFICDLANKVKRLLLEDEANLNSFKSYAIPGEAGVVRLAKSIKNAEAVVDALRSIGGALKCSSMIRQALRRRIEVTDEFVYETDLLSEVDNAPQLWSSLSHAISASMCTAQDFWKHADFINRLNAHANNAHLVATGVCAILKKTQDAKILKQREVEFVASFSTVLLEMKKEQSGEFKEWPLRGITLFLEKIVEESTCLSSGDLDPYIPFPIIHAAMFDRALNKVFGNDIGMGPEEFSQKVLENAKQLVEDETTEQDEQEKVKRG